MQWLIDLVIAAIGIPPTYVDRGNPHPPDFTYDDLTFDGAWHTLDFSSVIPAGASAVNMSVKAQSDAVGKIFRVRKDDTALNLNTCMGKFIVADLDQNFTFAMGLTTARTLDYQITAGNYVTFSWRTRGWWF